MLVTPEFDRRNRRHALTVAGLVAVASLALGSVCLPLLSTLALAPATYWLLRRRCVRRIAVASRPFPSAWSSILETRVRFYRALSNPEQERFRKMVITFLDEVRVTGVRTSVDDTVRVLVAASAIIPVFGFTDWDYHRLGEVLIYPASFDHGYHTESDANILGLAGFGHLRGVVILSKPSLLEGFSESPHGENVGVHEFTHLVEEQEAESGLPSDVPPEIARQWVEYVARELAHPSNQRNGISDYAYTNDREFLAVVSEYFFESPEKLKTRDPNLYDLLRRLFHQDPVNLFSHLTSLAQTAAKKRPMPVRKREKVQGLLLEFGPVEAAMKEASAKRLTPQTPITARHASMTPHLDVDACRRQFPGLARQVNGRPAAFLDGPGGSQVPQTVIDAVADCLTHRNANDGGAFATSRAVGEIVDGGSGCHGRPYRCCGPRRNRVRTEHDDPDVRPEPGAGPDVAAR